MMSEAAIQAALDGLDALLEDLTLPPRTTQTIERLGERLASPVRIALMGPQGAGKSTLINVLAGETVLPPGITLPTTQLQYAPEQMLAVTVADGTRRGFEALDFEAALALKPLFIEVALPAPRLRHIGLLEVVTDGTDADMQAAGRWAAKRSEMMLWVTRGFDHLQQQLWRKVPQALRDHAFLVLNGTDDFTTSDLNGRIEAHESFSNGEFLGLTPISAKLAFDALGTGDEDERMLASGCQLLLEGIFQHIAHGRQADIDAAAMYLQRFGRDLILPEEPDRAAGVQPTRLLYSHKTTGPSAALDASALRQTKDDLLERATAIKTAATSMLAADESETDEAEADAAEPDTATENAAAAEGMDAAEPIAAPDDALTTDKEADRAPDPVADDCATEDAAQAEAPTAAATEQRAPETVEPEKAEPTAAELEEPAEPEDEAPQAVETAANEADKDDVALASALEAAVDEDPVPAFNPGSPDPEARAAPNFYLKRFGLMEDDEAGDATPRFDEAVARIEACAVDLLRQIEEADTVETDTVLQCCLETVEAIADCVATDAGVQETVFQASDFLLLLQMEKSPSVAEDAVVALMQIKRDCEMAVA